MRDETRAGLRLTRRGRVVVALAALTVALLGSSALAEVAVAGGGSEPVLVQPRTVVAGDTLWEIAGTVTEPGQDIRDVVDRIVVLNGLPDGNLRAGQQILVPLP